MPANAHATLAQLARHQGAAVRELQIGRRQGLDQLGMQTAHRVGAVQPPSGVIALGHQLTRQCGLADFFGADVSHGQALLARQIGIAGEVLLQRRLDVAGPGVSTLDAVGLVRIHSAQQLARLLLRTLGRHCAQCIGRAR